MSWTSFSTVYKVQCWNTKKKGKTVIIATCISNYISAFSMAKAKGLAVTVSPLWLVSLRIKG